MVLPARALIPFLAAAVLLGLPPAPARAASTLEVVTAATYRVLPELGRVHVAIEATATSRLPDSDGRVLTGLSFSVQPGIANLVAASGGTPLTIEVERQADEFTQLGLTFAHPLRFGESYDYSVDFDMVDAGGAAGRDIRIGRSVVAFPVWAFGSAGVSGGSVQVEIPANYNVDVEGAEMESSGGSGKPTVLSVDHLPDPFSFFAYVSADRPGAFTDTPLSIMVGADRAAVTIRAWEDDPGWAETMTSVLRRGLPVLHSLIGLDYPVPGPLNVEEAATSRLGEYAGVFNDTDDTITVRYDADAFVALHEAAHIWFNQKLFDERWIGEGFAELYAVRAGGRIGEQGETFSLSSDLLQHRIPLNSWGQVGVEDLPVEDYAYAASYELAKKIARRADMGGLRRVWAAAESGELAYQPIHSGVNPGLSVAVSQEGWQLLLDLLEERTGQDFSDLWSKWVVSNADRPLLTRRATTRETYRDVVDEAGSWELPQRIRYELGSWSFDEADEHLAEAAEVLDQRDLIDERAAALDLTPPPTLRAAFEGPRGPSAAGDEADAELATLATIDDAADLLAVEPSTVESIGLLGEQPQVDVNAARDAFEAGDLAGADQASARAVATRRGAIDAGRQRVALAGSGLLGLDALAMALLLLRRRIRRRRFERLVERVRPPAVS